MAGDDVAQDLVGALADDHQRGVSEVAFDVEFGGVAVDAVDAESTRFPSTPSGLGRGDHTPVLHKSVGGTEYLPWCMVTLMGWNVGDITDQSGSVAVVTGANSGFGYATARRP